MTIPAYILATLSFPVLLFVCVLSGVSASEPEHSPRKQSQSLFDAINKLILSSPPETRNYPLILQKSEILASQFPESAAALIILETFERWSALGLISNEQYAPFKKILEDCRLSDAKGRTFFDSIGKQYHTFLSSPKKDVSLLNGIKKSCEDVLTVQNTAGKMKCYALLWLTRISFAENNTDKAELYLKQLFIDRNIAEQDFSEAETIFLEANRLKATIFLQKEGLESSIDCWKEYIKNERCSFDDIAFAYEQMFLLFDTNGSKENTEKKIQLLEEFIGKYPDNKSEQILQAKLTLGYTVLNNNTDLSGVVTAERVQEHKIRYKSNAEKAEKLFREALEDSQNTSFENAFKEALVITSQSIESANQKTDNADFRSIYEAKDIPAADSRRIITLIIINVVVIVIFLVYRKRAKIISFVHNLFRRML
ncbi:hypothetical protein FACS18942_09750 [Planctomycetales bacterium]|nr:hypothetical protein FACS18942_09750 [Planctomycetales bacterium]